MTLNRVNVIDMAQKILAVLTALLLLLLAGAQLAGFSSANFFPDPGPDLPHIYIRSNGDVEPATVPIEREGNTYKLTGNIVMQTIVIQHSNIVLDGSGYLIEGNKSWMGLAPHWGDSGNNGIVISGQNNINITNLNIEKFTAGVRVSGSSHINIVGNSFNEETAVHDTPTGIVIEASSHVLIENNNFTKINGPAIACNGTNITIRGNTLTDIIDGINGSITLQGSSNTIMDNRVETGSLSIKLSLSDSNLITKNRVTGYISFLSCSNNIVSENSLTGIRITFGLNNTVYGNYIENNSTIIELTQTVNNTFYANTFPANCSIRYSNFDTQGNVLDAESKFWDNFWDNGTIGNYWSAYTGTDSNGDGIGDSPYIVPGVRWDTDADGDVSLTAGQDNYPLMAPYDPENETVVLPQTPPYLALPAAAIVAILAVAGLLIYRKKRKSNIET
jgi:parallel beta-helix repeat protein